MKVIFVPVFFQSAQNPDFINQLVNLKTMLEDEVEFLDKVTTCLVIAVVVLF